jgi:multidrug efflux pump
VFGVTISAILTLFVVPALYVLFAKRTHSPQHMSQMIEKLRQGIASGNSPDKPGTDTREEQA